MILENFSIHCWLQVRIISCLGRKSEIFVDQVYFICSKSYYHLCAMRIIWFDSIIQILAFKSAFALSISHTGISTFNCVHKCFFVTLRRDIGGHNGGCGVSFINIACPFNFYQYRSNGYRLVLIGALWNVFKFYWKYWISKMQVTKQIILLALLIKHHDCIWLFFYITAAHFV